MEYWRPCAEQPIILEGPSRLDSRPNHRMFVDPRSSPSPSEVERGGRTTHESSALAELVTLWRQGRLYDVERWIADDVGGGCDPPARARC